MKRCIFCGTRLPKHPYNRECCNNEACKEKQRLALMAKRRAASKQQVIDRRKSRGVRYCAICHKQIEWEQDLRRNYCLNPECERVYKKQQHKKQTTYRLDWYHKNKGDFQVFDKQGHIPQEEYFSNTIFKQEEKERRKPNGWKCRECGKSLRGPNRFFCEKHKVKAEKVSRIYNLEGGCLYDTNLTAL